MKLSMLFTKTQKTPPADEVSANAKLLIQAGYIHKEMAGVYAYLPLGLKVFENIKEIIREEMNALGAHELIMTSLQPKENWVHTNRWDDKVVDVWFKTALKNGTEVGLGWSHEEPITLMMKNHLSSYRDLPANVYQFQNKMRNETRAKSGIMRTREFVMKDLYSYSQSESQHQRFYEQVTDAYMKIFKRVGLGEKTFFTFASGGAFTQFSHEFQTLCEAGEDVIYVDRKKNIAVNQEVFRDDVIKQLGLKKSDLEEHKAAEVGNIFSFGTTKSEELDLYFTDESGTRKPVVLGSYGIGVGRLMGVVVEVFSDENGLVWPGEIAPFQVHLALLAQEKKQQADDLYRKLSDAGIEVLYDDRDLSVGQKLGDADMLGMPVRLVIGNKTGDKVEYKKRSNKKSELLTVAQVLKKLS